MKKQLFFMLTLLAFALLLAAPTGPVAAGGAVRTPFTGVENQGYCSGDPMPDICLAFSPGDTKPLPNGKGITRGLVMVIEFQSEEPRINGVTIATFDIKPGSNSHTPISGTLHLQPYDIDGYWEGPVNIAMTSTGWRSVYSAKGYDDLEGQILQGINESGQLSGVIIELP